MTPFLVGIDLGTTNSACAYVDTRSRDDRVQVFQTPQLVEPFIVEPRPVLPSFLYFGEQPEIETGALALPWDPLPAAIAGVLARDRGAEAPARQVETDASSAAGRPSSRQRAA